GEVRVVLLDAQPIHRQTQPYRLVDAATGEFERGYVRVADMVVRQPWDATGPVHARSSTLSADRDSARCGALRPRPVPRPARIASAIGGSPLLNSMVRRMVPSSARQAAATRATSSRVTSPFAASGPAVIFPVAGSMVSRPGPRMVQSSELLRRCASAAALASA